MLIPKDIENKINVNEPVSGVDAYANCLQNQNCRIAQMFARLHCHRNRY